MGMNAESATPEVSPASSVAASLLMPDLNSESPYDLPRASDRALSAFIRLVSVQGGWFAIRRGDSLEVRAQWNASTVGDLVLSLDSHALLRRMNRNLTPMVVNRGDPPWSEIPHKGLKKNTKAWICVPLVIGQRLIGAVGLWRSSAFKGEEWNRLVDLATQIAPALETLITFAEMAGHLRRLAMLNDFALTVSTGRSLDQIARRMFALLSRAFGTELIVLSLLSFDDHVLQEYRVTEGNLISMLRGVEGHPISRLLAGDTKVRLSELDSTYALPLYPEALAGVYVPLRFRGRSIGMLSVESERANAFNSYDESLILVIASHLASLADYTRVREEAEGRARNLGVIHEVVQQVVGLTDPRAVAELTAELLARYFAYELTAVFIADESGRLTIGGFGGASQNVIKRAMKSVEYPLIGGITGHVFETGQGVLVNDVLQDERYTPVKGWQAGSEMCVAIRDGAKALGIIDVESSSRNAFTHNDYMALESLAGILATVITSADQYQRLQEMIYQLRETEMELNARMEAQRLAENRLVQAAKLAAVGEMAAGIAHELNNPLTSVTGFAELVMDDLPAESPSRPDLDLVIREARRARDVVRRLLDFARQSESARANASLNKVVEDVVALTHHLIHTNGVELTLELQEDLPWVFMDENQMKQVLLNLVHNALQAMPGGGQMAVRTAASQKVGRDGVIVSVRDNGVGIEPEDQARIFEPFFTTKADRGGTGLGLSVTYGIVSDHGGEIELISQPGMGSTFTVWLPKA
jgi:signal transduction histidine kinase